MRVNADKTRICLTAYKLEDSNQINSEERYFNPKPQTFAELVKSVKGYGGVVESGSVEIDSLNDIYDGDYITVDGEDYIFEQIKEDKPPSNLDVTSPIKYV